VDLSLASLSYAKRKTQELGLTNIEYAQADILKLESLGRSFDVIESGGVLHHLEDPFKGWMVLLSLLRKGGFMGVALYSEVARRDVVKAREYIEGQGYTPSIDDIRKCRQDLINLSEFGEYSTLLEINDFYSVSDCRDFLFHVQEHRMTLTGIDSFLKLNNLAFLGFQISPQVLVAYHQRFPDDKAAVNLDQWNIFEHENPDTFMGMYQFWIQKLHDQQPIGN
jgi:SAM-dependent methyltransferase